MSSPCGRPLPAVESDSSNVAKLTRDMGMTHADFFRTFPAVAGEASWQVHGTTVILQQPLGPVTIHLGPQRERRIGGLLLPATLLEFEFADYGPADIDAFMKRFDQSFRRGGG